jgi:hypothetical protein
MGAGGFEPPIQASQLPERDCGQQTLFDAVKDRIPKDLERSGSADDASVVSPREAPLE